MAIAPLRVLILDNYDSYTQNLRHQIARVSATSLSASPKLPHVIPNDAMRADALIPLLKVCAQWWAEACGSRNRRQMTRVVVMMMTMRISVLVSLSSFSLSPRSGECHECGFDIERAL